jgi:hypothetical protein
MALLTRATYAMTFLVMCLLVDPVFGQDSEEGTRDGQRTVRRSALHKRFTCFLTAYPDLVTRLHSMDSSQYIYMELTDGKRMVWDDGQDKAYEEKLSEPDIEDTVSQPYPGLGHLVPPSPLMDPGRFRHLGLLKALYGADAKSVRANLETVHWLPGVADKKLKFNRRHGAAKALRRVSRDLLLLGKQFHKYVRVTAGTFNWRYIKGSDRLSAHAFGIAIDIDVRYTDYWRWAIKKDGTFAYRNGIPQEIVHAFERHGFIWGGRWWHFDTMHFEYRPALLQHPCRMEP